MTARSDADHATATLLGAVGAVCRDRVADPRITAGPTARSALRLAARWLAAAAARIATLEGERLALARLAHPEPQFANPLDAWGAQQVRDRVLADAARSRSEVPR